MIIPSSFSSGGSAVGGAVVYEVTFLVAPPGSNPIDHEPLLLQTSSETEAVLWCCSASHGGPWEEEQRPCQTDRKEIPHTAKARGAL